MPAPPSSTPFPVSLPSNFSPVSTSIVVIYPSLCTFFSSSSSSPITLANYPRFFENSFSLALVAGGCLSFQLPQPPSISENILPPSLSHIGDRSTRLDSVPVQFCATKDTCRVKHPFLDHVAAYPPFSGSCIHDCPAYDQSRSQQETTRTYIHNGWSSPAFTSLPRRHGACRALRGYLRRRNPVSRRFSLLFAYVN